MSFGRRQPTGYFGVERRGSVRQPADTSALILLPTLERMTGRVVNHSSGGVRLDVPSPFGLPATFALRVRGRTHSVKVVRRGGGHVGLQFI